MLINQILKGSIASSLIKMNEKLTVFFIYFIFSDTLAKKKKKKRYAQILLF